MLWFVKEDKPNIVDFVSDLIESNTPEKIAHEMEQSIVEAQHIISRLTVENQVVTRSDDGFWNYWNSCSEFEQTIHWHRVKRSSF